MRQTIKILKLPKCQNLYVAYFDNILNFRENIYLNDINCTIPVNIAVTNKKDKLMREPLWGGPKERMFYHGNLYSSKNLDIIEKRNSQN